MAKRDSRSTSDRQWWVRLKIFRDVFPWTNDRIKELAGLPPDATIPGTHEDNLAFHRAHELYMQGGNAKQLRDKVVAMHTDQNTAWKELTGFPSALGTPRAWRAAARAAGVQPAALDKMTVETMAEPITEWALSLRAKGPQEKLLIELGGEFSPGEYKIVKYLWDRGATPIKEIFVECLDKAIQPDSEKRTINRLETKLIDIDRGVFIKQNNGFVTLERPDK